MDQKDLRRGPLLKHLDAIDERCRSGSITLRELFVIFGDEGHYVLILFFILPFLQPIPLFGLSTPFGILIAVITVLSYYGKPPWLPKRWENKKLSAQTVGKIAEGAEKIFEKISFMLHPRWPVLFREPFKIMSLVLILSNATLLALPLPIPFSNAIPAWMIFFQALGQVEDDGLFIAASYVMTIICAFYFLMLGLGADAGLRMLWP